MEFIVNVVKSVKVEIDDSTYDKEMIENIKEYWDLGQCNREETLEFVADMITSHYLKYGDLNELEGIANDKNAHEVELIHYETDVEVIK